MDNNQPVWLKYGIIYGLASIVLSLLTYYVFPQGMIVTIVMVFVSIAIGIYILLLAGKEQRRLNGNVLPFSEAVKTTFLSGMVGVVISTLFSIILLNLIDSGLSDRLTEMTIDSTRSMMEKLNLPEEEIEKAMEDIEENAANAYSTGKLLLSMVMNSVWILILSLIVSAIIKRDPQPFDNINDDDPFKTIV